jgi:hypothetical protein
MVGRGEMKLEGLGSTGDHCGALAVLDWGSEAAGAADDGGQWWQRRSGEGVSSGKKKCCGLEVLG